MMGEIKDTMNKAMDALAGTGGKMSAAMTTGADGFVQNAAIGDLYEITAARMALARARSAEVRTMAANMIKDHTTSTHHLMAALEMRETPELSPLPAEPDARRATMLKHLDEAQDEAFDTTYLDQQVLAHEETVSLMRSYASGGDNAQLRSYAAGTLPVVERHLARVKELRGQI